MIKGLASTSIKGGMDNIIELQYEERKAKELAEKERQFLASIKLGDIRAANEDTLPEAATQICPYFKAGLCQKGKRCKFSHIKGADGVTKANIYQDIRGADEGADSMNNWDQKKLEEAVNFNQNKYVNPNATDLPCHNFLNAIAEKRYGWFWVCPNGVNCKYKPALPAGFVLKTTEKKEKVEFNVERDIDAARQALAEGAKGTPVTFERFVVWRDNRRARKAKEAEEKKISLVKQAGIKVAKGRKIMTGRALFVFDPT
jgi:ssDNA-binding Zn-finger/Zn-ribbon topoisomerase 1